MAAAGDTRRAYSEPPDQAAHRLGCEDQAPEPNATVDSSPTIDPEALWTIDDLASYLGIPKHTIYGWRTTNYGPPAIKVGKNLRWRPEGVVAWAKKQELSDE